MVASTTFRLLLLAGCLLKASPFASIPWWSQPIIIDSTAPLDGWRPASVKTRRYLGVPRKPVNVQCHWAQSCSGYSKENVFFFFRTRLGPLGSRKFFHVPCKCQLPNLDIYSVSSPFYSAILHVLLHILPRATYRQHNIVIADRSSCSTPQRGNKLLSTARAIV